MLRRRQKALRQIYLTPEGWVFIVILGFIATGAVLRNVNLLILMAGLMFAPLIINWRIGVLRLKSLSAKRTLPHRIYAKQFFNVQWICNNQANFSAWNIQVLDEINRVENQRDPATDEMKPLHHDSSQSGQRTISFFQRFRNLRRRRIDGPSNARINFVQIGGHESEVASYRVYFARRGKYALGPAALMTSFPFGLVASRIRMPQTKIFYVAPQLGTLSLTWERRVQSAVVGSDALKRKRGLDDDEFYALRPWRSGDSKKHIHWRTSAKFGQPIVRQHDQPDNRDFAMLLDLHFEGKDQAYPHERFCLTCETALSFAATLILHLGTAVHGRIAVGVCGETNQICRSRNHREIVDQAMQRFALAEPTNDPNIIDTLLDLSRAVSDSTPLYVISSRDAPSYLSNPGQSEVADDSAELGSSTDESSEQEQRRFNRLKNIGPNVRWIRVGSEEFQKLYTPHEFGKKGDPDKIEQLTEKWMSKNAPC